MQLHPEVPNRRLHTLTPLLEDFEFGIPEDGYTGEAGPNLLEQLDLFGHKLLVRNGQAREVAPRASEASNQPVFDGIRYPYHHHRDRAGSPTSRAGRGIPKRDHDIGVPLGYLQGDFGEALVPHTASRHIEVQVAT